MTGSATTNRARRAARATRATSAGRALHGRLTAGPMLRHTLSVLTGTAGGQLVAIAATPLLTRLYSPVDYGGYSYLASVTLIVAGIACLRLERAVPLPESDEEAREVIAVASLASLCFAALTAVALLGVRQLEQAPPILHSVWVWVVPPAVFATAEYTLWSQAALRLEDYSAVARRSFTQNASTVIFQGVLAPLRWGTGGLLVGQLGARVLSTVQLILSSRELIGGWHWRGCRRALSRFARFPCVMAPAALFNVLGTYLPVLLVGWLYGQAEAGHLGVAQQVVLLPSMILGTAVGQVYVGRLSASRREGGGDDRRVFLRASAALTALALPFALGVILLGPQLLPVLLGERWAAAGPMAAAMAVSAAFGLVVSPLSYVLVAFERSWTTLLLDVLRVLVVAAAGYLGFRMGADALVTTLAMFLAQASVYALTWLVCLRIVGAPERR